MQPVSGITQLLVRWSKGEQSALDELMPLVYDELRKLARSYLHRERKNHSLQPTALVNEAYLRMADQKNLSWQERAQFFGMAARLMRNILVDHARNRQAAKRGGELFRVSLSKADRITRKPDVDLIALDDALNRLAEIMPDHSRIVELRFFGGLTIPETAEVLGKSHATVEREWSFARSWLRSEIADEAITDR